MSRWYVQVRETVVRTYEVRSRWQPHIATWDGVPDGAELVAERELFAELETSYSAENPNKGETDAS